MLGINSYLVHLWSCVTVSITAGAISAKVELDTDPTLKGRRWKQEVEMEVLPEIWKGRAWGWQQPGRRLSSPWDTWIYQWDDLLSRALQVSDNILKIYSSNSSISSWTGGFGKINLIPERILSFQVMIRGNPEKQNERLDGIVWRELVTKVNCFKYLFGKYTSCAPMVRWSQQVHRIEEHMWRTPTKTS